MAVLDQIKKLTKQLYPTGRAFKIFPNSVKEKLHDGLAVSEAQAYLDALSIRDSALPDNDNFTADDATDWERRLGLITNTLVSLANRKLAITRKMNYGLDVRPRASYLFIERELRAAGFDVYVHENLNGYTPETVINIFYQYEHGIWEHGQIEHGYEGESPYTLAVNFLDETVDALFDVGTHYKNTFFIGGPSFGEYADVDLVRKQEFRQLVLKLKPQQMAAYLLINYI